MTKLGFLAAASLLFGACTTSDSSSTHVDSLTADPGACGAIETHVVGIYSSPTGEATVTVDRPGQHVLVLSAYEATRWHVQLGAGASLEHVYLTGYHAQTIDGVPAGVDVLTDSFDTDGTYGCGYSYPYDGGGCDTDGLMRLAAGKIHHDATTFHGCRSATEWNIGYDLTTSSDCAVEDAAASIAPQADWIGGCAANAQNDDPDPIGCGGPTGG
jgi:hypothetical protein